MCVLWTYMLLTWQQRPRVQAAALITSRRRPGAQAPHPCKSFRPCLLYATATVGDQIPADIRVTKLFSNILRADQVCGLTSARAHHAPVA